MSNKLKLGGGKTGFFRRLSRSKPSPMLVTTPNMPATDLCHPFLDRPLSVEEYAAIQEFPQNWQICGPLKEQYRQLGNAVPLGLGRAIARLIVADMTGVAQPHAPAGFKFSRFRNSDEISWRADFEKAWQRGLHAASKSASKEFGSHE